MFKLEMLGEYQEETHTYLVENYFAKGKASLRVQTIDLQIARMCGT